MKEKDGELRRVKEEEERMKELVGEVEGKKEEIERLN